MKRPEMALIALALTLFACEKEARQPQHQPVAPTTAADPAPKAEPVARDPASAACTPIELTRVEATCLPYLRRRHPGTVTLLRSQAELDALYASGDREMLNPACKATPHLGVDWAKHSLLLVETGGACQVESTATACRAADGLHVEANVVSIGTCEKAVVVKDVYTVPAVAPGVQVHGSFKASKRDR